MRCIGYIRVSTDEQALRGGSLTNQRDRILQYAHLNGFIVDKIFSEDYSAKTFDRPEWKKLFKYCQYHKKEIQAILVVRWDRFSRNASESYQVIDRLKRMSIEVIAAEQPLDLSVPESKLMLSYYLTSPEVENDRRSINVKQGMIQKLKRGEWMAGKLPRGFWKDRNTGEISITKDGELIRRGFELVLKGSGISEVAAEISILGFTQSPKIWSKTLRNVFYAGKITHSLIDYEVIEGKHTGLISYEDFNKVQEVLKANVKGPRNGDDLRLPLKHFLLCDDCKRPLTAYQVKKKQTKTGYREKKSKPTYYKCNTPGCKVNVSTNFLHSSFQEMLYGIVVNEEIIGILTQRLTYTFNRLSSESKNELKAIRQHLTEVNTRLNNADHKFIDGSIDTGTYQRVKNELLEKKVLLESESGKRERTLSNPRKFIEFSLKLLSKLPEIWQKSHLREKIALQRLLFPEGLTYNKTEGVYRTPSINRLFLHFALECGKNRKGQQKLLTLFTFGSP